MCWNFFACTILSWSAAFCTTVLRLFVWSIINLGSFCPAVSCWDRYSEVLLVASWTVNMQIVGEYYFILYFIYLLNFFVFSFDLNLRVFVAHGLVGSWAYGWVTVSANFPCGRFCPYLGCGVTPSHLSVLLPVCSTIVTWFFKDNLGFCQLWLIKKATLTIWQVPTLEYEKSH